MSSELQEQVEKTLPVDTQDGYAEDDDERALHDYISNLDDIQEQLVEVPEWHRKILVIGLNADERYTVFQSHTNMQTGEVDLKGVFIDLVIKACRHPRTLKPIFSMGDRGMLSGKNSGAVDRLATMAADLSGMTATIQEALRKN